MSQNPQQTSASTLILPDGKFEYGGFWARFAAHLIDMVIYLFITLPIIFYIYGINYIFKESLFAGFWDVILNVILPTIAVILFWRFRSATPGKMIIDLRIVDATTLAKPTTAQLIIRYFAYLVSIIPLFAGFIWVGIDKRKQGFHDKLAKTVVIIRKR